MSTKTMRLSSPGQRYSTRRLVDKLNLSDTLSKDLIARAFLKAPKLAASASLPSYSLDGHHQADHLLLSQSSFQTTPSTVARPGDQYLEQQRLLSESFTSFISIDNGLGAPTRRPTHSPRRSPRRTLSSCSPSKRSKKPLQYPQSKQQLPRLCDSCPDFDCVPTAPKVPPIVLDQLSLVSAAKNHDDVARDGNDGQQLPEQDAALGKKSIRQIESHKRFFQERRPNRHRVKFEAVKEVSTPAETHILHLSVSDLELPPDLVADQECSREFSRAKQFEIIRELDRDLRATTRQVERFDEMIEYEAEIAQELEHENLDLRRRILEFPTCLPSRKDLKRQIQEAEAMLQEKKGGSKNLNTVSVGRRIDNV